MVHNLVYGQSGLGRFGRPLPAGTVTDSDVLLDKIAPAASVPVAITKDAPPPPIPKLVLTTPTTTSNASGSGNSSNVTPGIPVVATDTSLVSNFTSDAQAAQQALTATSKKKILIIGGVIVVFGLTTAAIVLSSKKKKD